MAGSKIGRIMLIVATAVALTVAGGAILGAVVQHRSGGYLPGRMPRFHTSTAALVTDEVYVGVHSAHPGNPEDTAKIRITVTSADPHTRIFVGLGRTRDVDRYLRGTAHDEFANATYPPFRPRFHRQPGRRTAAAPTTEDFWVVSSTGRGRQVITWTKPHGAWTLVVMNQDGSPGVTVRAKLGFHLPFTPIAVGAVIVALVSLWFAVGRPRPRRSSTRRSSRSAAS